MRTLRDVVEGLYVSPRYEGIESSIRFELNHLELHGLDDYLLTCYDKKMYDTENKTNSNIKYLLEMTDTVHLGNVTTSGGSWPDLDVDFEHEKRDQVKQHLKEVYGSECVASIGTVSFAKAKGVFKDVARVYGLDFKKSNDISKLFPDMCDSIQDALDGSQELCKLIENDEEVAEVFDYARHLEGTVRAIGVHAAGVAISPGPLTDIVPLFESKGEAVTMFDGPTLEDIGIVKYDILGLKALTVISRTVDFIKETTGEVVNIFTIKEDDNDTYDIIKDGNTLGIFQVEGSKALRDFAAACKPNCINDIGAIIALYRPGPIGLGALDEYILRRNGSHKAIFDIPEFNYIFEDTYGLLIYQEQLMHLSGDMCGFDDIQRDVLRKATAKKDRVLLKSLKDKFVAGAVSNTGQDAEVISALFDRMEEFSRYSFNKSHAIAYAYITYQTAYLKAHYPSEYMAASISCEPEPEQQSIYMSDARRNGVQVMPPDLNQSKEDFTVGKDGEILFGFSSIKGIAGAACKKLLMLKPYTSFGDFLIRAYYIKGINKKVIDALVCSGACDTFGYRRSNLLAGFERFIIDYSSECPEEYNSIHANKFCKNEESYFVKKDIHEFPILKILELEKTLLGVHISGNPFDYVGSLVSDDYRAVDYLNQVERGSYCVLCQINKVKQIQTKKGDPMAFIDVTDQDGAGTNMIVFPNVFPKASPSLIEDKYVLIYLNVKTDTRGKSFLVTSIRDLTKAIDDVSDRIDEEKNMKSINLHIEAASAVRFKSIVNRINQYRVEEDSNYSAVVYTKFGNTLFRLDDFNVRKIDISMLRSFSKISGLIVQRGI